MSQQIRLGKCLRCGACCRNCEHLTILNTCDCYDNRPDYCIQDFPRNQYDISIRGLDKQCGYKFMTVIK